MLYKLNPIKPGINVLHKTKMKDTELGDEYVNSLRHTGNDVLSVSPINPFTMYAFMEEFSCG